MVPIYRISLCRYIYILLRNTAQRLVKEQGKNKKKNKKRKKRNKTQLKFLPKWKLKTAAPKKKKNKQSL
jgi:hypothetical protein